MSHNDLADRIRKLRGKTPQKDFAAKIGIAVRSYIRYESGERTPPVELFIKLSEIGGRSIDWILTGKEVQPQRVSTSENSICGSEIAITLADRLKEVISDSGLNLKEFSAKVDIPYRTLQDYLSGIITPGGDNLLKIYKEFNVSLTWLLAGTGAAYVKTEQKAQEEKSVVDDVAEIKRIVTLIAKALPSLAISLVLILLAKNIAFADESKKVYVETPSLCTAVDKVEGDSLYLETTQPTCPQIKGKVLVNVAADVQDLDVYVDGKFWKKINIADNGSILMDAINSATGHADKMGERLNDQHNQHEEWGQEKASEIAAFYYSDAYQHRIASETERLKSTVFRDVVSTSGNPDNEAKKNDAERGNHWLKASERLYLFISSSVPAETLRAYARAIDKIGDPRIVLVMNGFAGGVGNFKKMLDFIVSFKTIDPECNIKRGECQFYKTNLQIDPLLFRKYGIDVVPAVVYAVGSNLERPDVPDHNADVASYYMMKGDASLEYYLDSMQRESKSASLTKLLERLRSGFYDN